MTARDNVSDVESTLPLVIVKDPLSWMASLCGNAHSARFRAWFRHVARGICPSPVTATAVTVAWHKTQKYKYSSLASLWNIWHREYVDAPFPALLLRHEDLIYDPNNTVAAVCRCAGGRIKRPPRSSLWLSHKQREALRAVAGARSAASRGSSRAAWVPTSERERYAPYTTDDLAFLTTAVDPGLLRFFSYRVDASFVPSPSPPPTPSPPPPGSYASPSQKPPPPPQTPSTVAPTPPAKRSRMSLMSLCA